MAEPRKERQSRQQPEPELRPIEDLMAATGADAAAHAGACARQGWARGKQVTETEYRAAVDAWKEAPING